MKTGIYKIQNQINGKVYIGSGIIKQRFYYHRSKLKHNKHPNNHLQSSWSKYGGNSFNFNPLIYCDEGGLGYYEELLIVDVFESYKRENGYNFKKGRNTGVFDQASRDKISKKLKKYYKNNSSAMKGRSHTEKTRKMMSEAHTGRSRSEETKMKISKAKKGASYNVGEENPSWKGGKIDKKCKKCGNDFQVNKYRDKTSKYCTKDCRISEMKELKKGDVIEIKKLLKNDNWTQKEISNVFNVSKSTISAISTGRNWGHITTN